MVAASALALAVLQSLLAGEASVVQVAITALGSAVGAIGMHSGVKNGVQGGEEVNVTLTS